VLLAGDALSDHALTRARGELCDAASATLGTSDARADVAYEVRYRGQAHELTVRDLPDDVGVAEVRSAFEDLHERYGYRDTSADIEVVTVRATAIVDGPELDLAAGTRGGCERSRRRVIFGGESHDAEVLRGEPAPEERFAGPAICELPEATLAVPPGWEGFVDEAGTIVLEHG